MPDDKQTTITIRSNWPVAISSLAHGSNTDSMGFNLELIALKNPKLAIEIMKVYAEASRIKADDPQAPDEDMELFNKELKDFLKDN